MKKLPIFLALFFTLSIGVVHAQSNEVIKLYDDVLFVPGCELRGVNSCAQLDGTEASNVVKTVQLKRFVPGSGYLGIYFSDKKPQSGTQGGFSFDQVYFEPSSGGRVELGGGLQVFERGNLVVEFVQPHTNDARLETQYDFVFYYLPHTEEKRQQFLTILRDDPDDFVDYKERNKNDINALCSSLSNVARVPTVCPQPTQQPDTSSGGGFTSDPNSLPELDFSGIPKRKPIVTMRNSERLTFVGEPVKIIVDQVYDPDGKCEFYEFRWQKSDDMMARDPSVDPYLGDLYFIPENVGVFTLNFQATEFCKELGTLTSDRAYVRVVVNDKSVIFPDLDEAPKYQNAIYQLYHLGVLRGYPDGLMRPNEPVNRAEFLKMIFETLQYRIDKEVFSPRYPDVVPTDWFSYYISQGDTLGVIKGYPDGRFRPEQPVNLAEALKMVMHFSTLDIKDSDVYKFPDVQNSDWFSRYVQTAFREGILDDIQPGSNVRPGQFISRGKAALIIVRTLLFPVNRINPTDKDVLRSPEQFEDFSSFTY